MLDQVLSTAEDLVVLDKAEDKVVVAFSFQGDIAKHYFDRTLSKSEEKNVDGSNRHWKFNDETGLIEGPSTFLALRLDQEARADGLWIPTPEQAMLLDKRGKLSKGVYRDFGIAVYSQANPNEQVAKELATQSQTDLPLVIPFKSLTRRLDEDFPYGIAIDLTNATEVKSGKQATKFLSEFKYEGNSGACRLYCGRNGNWYAGGVRLDCSSADGRVDWMCGEATRAEVKSAYEGLLKRQYDNQIQKLTVERDQKQADFEKSLE